MTNELQIGISPNGNTRDEVDRLAALAASVGIDRLWLGDGILTNDDFPGWRGGMESMTELAWLAGRHDLPIGITAAVLPLRDMDWLIREANTLDHLTDGDFVLAVAPGFWPEELAHRGVDVDRLGSVFEDQLTALRSGLAGGPLSPGPFRPGGPPVWLAGAHATMQRALRLGLPFQASRAVPDDLAPIADRYFSGGGVSLAHRIYVEVGDAAPAGTRVERNTLTGPADFLAEAIHGFADMGVSDLSLIVGHDEPSAHATLEALASTVLAVRPLVRDRT